MSVKSFIIVPLDHFTQMESELNRSHEQNSEKGVVEKEKVQPVEEESNQHFKVAKVPVEEGGGPTKTAKLSEEVVSLAQSQKLKERLVKSFIVTLQKYESNVKVDISNLKQLVHAALGTSQ